MTAVTITRAHFRDQMLQHLRAPGYLIPTLAMPALFFFLFQGEGESTVGNTFTMASYMMWAILAVAFFQFGVGIASERSTPWEGFLRTLPLPPLFRLAGRLLAAMVFAVVAAAIVVAVSYLTTPINMAANQWIPLTVALLAGGVTMAFAGIAIGYWFSPKAAQPVATMAWLLLAYIGGLWAAPNNLPGWTETIAPYLPTRLWGNITWPAALGDTTTLTTSLTTTASLTDWLGLAAYATLFSALAVWGYRRDEVTHYA
jgi:ABC-2 type transport system permease protein